MYSANTYWAHIMYKTSYQAVKNFYIKVELQEAFAFPKKKWAIERKNIILFMSFINLKEMKVY